MYEITVAVCVYKQKEWLHRCLRSLNSQTLEKSRYEVVVVNDDPNETLDDVIDIFKGINLKISSKLMMVGEGPEKRKALRYVSDNKLKDKVLFLGNSSEIDKILCYSDLFLLPSEKESFGLSALEAMAHGVPIISSNAGGIPEVNLNGKTGFLSNIGDTKSMINNAISLLSDPQKNKLFKKQAQLQAKKFDLESVVNSYERIYNGAVASINY